MVLPFQKILWPTCGDICHKNVHQFRGHEKPSVILKCWFDPSQVQFHGNSIEEFTLVHLSQFSQVDFIPWGFCFYLKFPVAKSFYTWVGYEQNKVIIELSVIPQRRLHCTKAEVAAFHCTWVTTCLVAIGFKCLNCLRFSYWVHFLFIILEVVPTQHI